MNIEEEELRTYLPSCWNDEKRMQSLFAPFRSKEINPTGWQKKMDMWVDMLNLFSRTRKMAVISANDICVSFQRNNKLPSCINEVLEYMHRQKFIQTTDEFVCDEMCKTWLGWSYYSFIRHPFNQAWLLLRGMFLPAAPQKFIFIDALKIMANKIFQKHKQNKISSTVDNIIMLKELEKQCIDICEGEDFVYAIMQLQYENKLRLFTEVNGTQIVKFRENGKEDIQFTDVDRSILRLKDALDKNSAKLVELEEEQAKYIIQARQYLKERSKDKALTVMKKKKRLELELQKKYTVQDNLETLFNQVRNCGSEKMIVNALKTGAHALRNYYNVDLTSNEVDNTMEEVQEALDDAAEIQRMMSDSVDVEGNDLSELESELKDILNEDQNSTKANAYYKSGTYGMADEFTPVFPEVPTGLIDRNLANKSSKKTKEAQAAT